MKIWFFSLHYFPFCLNIFWASALGHICVLFSEKIIFKTFYLSYFLWTLQIKLFHNPPLNTNYITTLSKYRTLSSCGREINPQRDCLTRITRAEVYLSCPRTKWSPKLKLLRMGLVLFVCFITCYQPLKIGRFDIKI